MIQFVSQNSVRETSKGEGSFGGDGEGEGAEAGASARPRSCRSFGVGSAKAAAAAAAAAARANERQRPPWRSPRLSRGTRTAAEPPPPPPPPTLPEGKGEEGGLQGVGERTRVRASLPLTRKRRRRLLTAGVEEIHFGNGNHFFWLSFLPR